MKGVDVISICGSDEHGVPITLKARKEGVTPQEIVDRYHTLNKLLRILEFHLISTPEHQIKFIMKLRQPFSELFMITGNLQKKLQNIIMTRRLVVFWPTGI